MTTPSPQIFFCSMNYLLFNPHCLKISSLYFLYYILSAMTLNMPSPTTWQQYHAIHLPKCVGTTNPWHINFFFLTSNNKLFFFLPDLNTLVSPFFYLLHKWPHLSCTHLPKFTLISKYNTITSSVLPPVWHPIFHYSFLCPLLTFNTPF